MKMRSRYGVMWPVEKSGDTYTVDFSEALCMRFSVSDDESGHITMIDPDGGPMICVGDKFPMTENVVKSIEMKESVAYINV